MSTKLNRDDVIQNTVYDVYENFDESKSTVDTIILPERDRDKAPILEIKGLGIDFGGLTAVDEFTLSIGRTEIAGIIGPNGAGKTTIFNLLTKVYQPTRGTFLFDGVDTAGMTTTQISKMGIARTFQNIRLFDKLTVEENVKAAMHEEVNYGLFSGIFHGPKYRKQEKAAHEKALELLSIFDMQDMADYQASSLPYGAQRRLEIVRALATDPKVLLLDEPAAGMNPNETEELMKTVRFIRDEFDITVLLIEQEVAHVAIGLGNRAFGEVSLQHVDIVGLRGGVWNLIGHTSITLQVDTCTSRNVINTYQKHDIVSLVIASGDIGLEFDACEVQVLRAAEGSHALSQSNELLRSVEGSYNNHVASNILDSVLPVNHVCSHILTVHSQRVQCAILVFFDGDDNVVAIHR